MKVEATLAEWVAETRFADLPVEQVELAKLIVRTIVGTTIAGSTAEGCAEVVELVREWGGAEEATILLYGGKAPAHAAVLANSTMARALDICDAADPGVHIGSSIVPVALAAAELAAGCSGEDFLAALVVGTELTMRLGFVGVWDGFDPSGVLTVFGSAAVAGRLLGLDRTQMLHALALAFNRAGGGFQSNIDGSLAVRLIQGFASQNGVVCAQLAERGLTGPRNFVEGRWGYYHLFAKGRRDDDGLAGELGSRWQMDNVGFKAYPSCGATIASTDAILGLVEEHGLEADDVERIEIALTEPCFRLVGHEFEIGDNPTVNAQFNVRYCVANALLKGRSALRDFDETSVRDPRIMELTRRIDVREDPELSEGQRELAARAAMTVTTRSGRTLARTIDGPSGFPPRRLTPAQHSARFRDNVEYGGLKPAPEDLARLVSLVDELEEVEDVRALVAPLTTGDLARA